MKPNFALSLYFDKVELLHRGEEAWTSVGEVAFEAEDLAGELSALRKTALTLDPAGLRTKLVLPDEQVKFLSLPDPDADDAAVRAALDAATPYALDELAWEHTTDGRRTHIAAVARETLAEAEAFAVEHRFAPVSIVAQSVVGRFDGEPYFGETKAASGLIGPDDHVERDDPPAAFVKGGEGGDSPDVTSGPAPEPTPDPIPEKPADPDVPAPKAAFEPVPEAEAARPLVADMLPASEDAAEADEAVTAKPEDTAPAAPEPAAEAPEPKTPEPADAPQVEEPVFASRNRAARTSGDGPASTDPLTVAMGATRAKASKEDPPSVAAPVEPATSAPAASTDTKTKAPSAPKTTGSKTATKPKPPRDAPAEPRTVPQPVPSRAAPGTPPPAVAERLAKVARANITADRIADMPPASVAPVPSRPKETAAVTPPPVVRPDLPPASTAKALGASLTPSDPPSTSGGGLFSSRRQPAAPPVARTAPPAVKVAPFAGEADASPQERRGMTVFDQRAAEQSAQRGRSRYMLPIMLAVLLLFMAAVAAFAAIFTEDGLASLWRSGTPQDPILTAAPSDPTPLESPGTPEIANSSEILLPGDSDPVDVAQGTPDQLALVAPEQGAALDPEVTADPVDTEDEIAQADPVVTPETPEGTVLSPAEAERFYAATGVWLRAPRLPFVPVADSLGVISTGDVEATADRTVLAVLVPPRSLNDDVAPPVQLDPPAADVVFDRDARGLLVATAEGTLTPYGMLIYAGLPDIVPPTRPGTPLPEVVAAPVEEVAEAPVEDPAQAIEEAPIEDSPEVAGIEDTTDAVTETLERLVSESLSAPAPVDPAPLEELATTTDLVVATPEGSVTTNGVLVFAGLPDVIPPSRPSGLTPETEEDPGAATEAAIAEALAATDADALPGAVSLAGLRPTVRPEALEIPEIEAPAVLAAFAGPRPILRPQDLVDEQPEEAASQPEIEDTTVAATLAAIVASAPDPLAGATNQAVAQAIIPEARPRNFDRVVAAAQARLASTVPQTTTTTTTQVTQPETVTSGAASPSGPVPQTVASAATVEGAINLREINLIGVFGRPNDRRALVRLANGQFVRVGVGDALDGGQVTAIGDNVINYVKRGRTIALGVPG